MIVDHNTISGNGDAGVVFSGSPSTYILYNDIFDNGNYGVYGQGPNNGFVQMTGNVFTNNPVHARFESGLIDLTGTDEESGFGNIFNFGDVALQFSPAPAEYDQKFDRLSFCEGDCGPGPEESFAFLQLVDDTIGAQFFNGQGSFFVELDNGAFFDPGRPTILDGIHSTYVTPFGSITPAATGGIIGADTYAFLEQMFYHYNDDNTLGLFFFGRVADDNPNIDQEDIFHQFNYFRPFGGNVNFTVNGLPFVDPVQLASIAPAAGDGDDSGSSAEELAGLEPAAGGDDQQKVHCWTDAISHAGQGHSVNYSFGSGLDEALDDAASCSGNLSGI